MEVLRPQAEVDLEAERAAFLEEMSLQYFNPPGGEKVIQAFHLGARWAIQHVPAYSDLVDLYLMSERNLSPSYRVNKFFKVHQHDLLRKGVRQEQGYPQRFLSASRWQRYITETYSDPESEEYRRLKENLQTRQLQTNRSRRANALAFVIGADYHNQPFSSPRVVHEGGSAAGHILSELIIGPSGDVVVLSPEGMEMPEDSDQFRSYVRTLRPPFFNRIPVVGKCIGIEINPPMDEDGKLFVKACSQDPSQLDTEIKGNPRQRAAWAKKMLIRPQMRDIQTVGSHEHAYDMLESVTPVGVETIQGDYLHLDEASEQYVQNNPADYVFFSLFVEQVVSQGIYSIKDLVRVTEPRVQPDAKIITNAYAEIDRDGELRVLGRWYRAPFLCGTFALDLSEPPAQRRWRTLMHWETSNCERVRMGRDIGWLAPDFIDLVY